MTIYGDVLVLVETGVNYLLLRLTATVAGAAFSRCRLLLAAALGAGYDLLRLMTGNLFLDSLPGRICAGCAMALIAFAGARQLQRLIRTFWCASFALGGAVLGLSRLGAGMSSPGRVTLLALTAMVVLAVWLFTGVFRGQGRQGLEQFTQVEIRLRGQVIRCRGLVDTGNALHSPLDNSPVLVLPWRLLRRVCPELEADWCADPLEGLPALNRCAPDLHAQLIPYRAVGTERGLLLAVRPEAVYLNGKRQARTLVALSPQSLSVKGQYEALVGG